MKLRMIRSPRAILRPGPLDSAWTHGLGGNFFSPCLSCRNFRREKSSGADEHRPTRLSFRAALVNLMASQMLSFSGVLYYFAVKEEIGCVTTLWADCPTGLRPLVKN
jgi:hypothetical protein